MNVKLHLSILLLSSLAKNGIASFCGCDSCTQEVWDSVATDSTGSFTCGARANWLRVVMGYDEARACAKISDEFVNGPCGPACDPSKCDPPTRVPTQPPAPPVAFCGCDSCTQEVWDSNANDRDGSFTCGDRINWLQTVKGYSEASACTKVSDQFIDGPCGPVCDPLKCGLPPPVPSKSPTTSPTRKPTSSPSLVPSKTPTDKPSLITDNPTPAPSKVLTPPPTSPNQMCGCNSCTEDILSSIADGHSCQSRIGWVMDNYGSSEADACTLVADEYPSICGMCHADHCGSFPPAPTPADLTLSPSTNDPADQKCGGAVDFTNDPNQACETYLWGPTGDDTMHCFAYGGSSDPCHLNNNNDQDDGIFKDPSQCLGDTFYLWDEPDTQGRDYTWAGTAWLEYSQRFAQELEQLRSQGAKVTGPLLKAGTSGVIERNMRTFFDACGAACLDPTDPAYIDVVAINGFCGPWNGAAGCRGGARFIYEEAASASRAFGDLPVYVTNWSRLQTSDPVDQVDAIDSVDEFFPASGVVERVYWFGARDYGGGAETTGYLNNILPDGRSLGEVWRAKCESI